MSALQTALKSLSPVEFSDLPTDKDGLDTWLSDLFDQSQLILDSIPIADPGDSRWPVSHSTTSIASNASEMTISSARSAPPIPEHQALQKEWGKPMKMGAKETALGMSVYKLSAKDGRGAWFARRSVHEGLPFSHFKKALEMEFPESLAVQGAPGEGNIRGIGGETRVEDIRTSHRGKVEVYRLSAQFPGPTTPRDFVTMLITSDNAMSAPSGADPAPRHYMIVSKPCNHPKTQPQDGFIRGYYESVEFIREVPRKMTTSQSVTDLTRNPHQSGSLSRDVMIKNAQQKSGNLSGDSTNGQDGEALLKAGASVPPQPRTAGQADSINSDNNPVEWVMITRSDPGGSVPRFMVERGTPSSICADAEKFLDWACKQDFFDEGQVGDFREELAKSKPSRRRESFASFRSSRMAGVHEEHEVTHDFQSRTERPISSSSNQGFLMGAVTGAAGAVGAVSGVAAHYLSTYTPQVVLDRIPGHHFSGGDARGDHLAPIPQEDEEDAASTVTRGTFESADSHLTTSGSEAGSHDTKSTPEKSQHWNNHEKELHKLQLRREALVNKFSESRSKLEQENSLHHVKEEHARQKASEKHEKEMRKQKEKYEKELRKLDQKQEREQKKLEARRKKQEEKDEVLKLTRERDEARQELELSKKESEVLRGMIEELQKENTNLVAQFGRSSLVDLPSEAGSVRRSNSLRRLAEKGRINSGSPSSSLKSQ